MSPQCHLIPSLYLLFPQLSRNYIFKLICVNQNPEEAHTLYVVVIYPFSDTGHVLIPVLVIYGFVLYAIGF